MTSVNFASVQVSCGCSAILALTLGERLYVASAGDSRAVLLRHPHHTRPLNIFASVRHVTGNDKDYLRKIPRVVW
jgi:serine/threonine protein phosphatase PrpC